jgi:hypothetical protein
MNKRVMPIQSTLLILASRLESSVASVRKIGTKTIATKMKGRLIQAIHLQLKYCAKTPPMNGPRLDPDPQTRPSKPRYFGLSRRVVISVRMISVKASMPPAPTPCIVRPAIELAAFFENPTVSEPIEKNTMEM